MYNQSPHVTATDSEVSHKPSVALAIEYAHITHAVVKHVDSDGYFLNFNVGISPIANTTVPTVNT